MFSKSGKRFQEALSINSNSRWFNFLGTVREQSLYRLKVTRVTNQIKETSAAYAAGCKGVRLKAKIEDEAIKVLRYMDIEVFYVEETVELGHDNKPFMAHTYSFEMEKQRRCGFYLG